MKKCIEDWWMCVLYRAVSCGVRWHGWTKMDVLRVWKEDTVFTWQKDDRLVNGVCKYWGWNKWGCNWSEESERRLCCSKLNVCVILWQRLKRSDWNESNRKWKYVMREIRIASVGNKIKLALLSSKDWSKVRLMWEWQEQVKVCWYEGNKWK